MLTKLIFKLMFRAMLPLVAMVGIASFGLHSTGGDPLAILKRVGGGFGDQVANLLGGARDSAQTTLSAAKSGLGKSGVAPAKSQKLYRWTDSSGVTHFSSEPPAGAQNVSTVTVDPNQNLMSATRAPEAVKTSSASDKDDPVQDVMNRSMPGISGVALQGMNPNEIIGQFQKSQEARMP